MKLSIYTAAKNAIAQDFHVEAMLRHHLPLADEIVVNEGYSTDDTYERIRNIDPKIRVFRTQWEQMPKNLQWWVGFKEAARKQCTGDWCILLDCDEFIPEWEFEAIRRHLETTTETFVAVRFVNFYGSYRVFHGKPEKERWPAHKVIIHRNSADMEVWGDGSNVKLKDQEAFRLDPAAKMFTVHHFGMVRHPAILRYKWWIQGRAMSGRPSRLGRPKFLFRMFPHDWKDPQFFGDLELYEGPNIRAVNENPREFIRDHMKLEKWLLSERSR